MLPRRLLTPVCLVVYDDDDEYDDDGRDVLDGVAGFLAQGFLFHMVKPNRRSRNGSTCSVRRVAHPLRAAGIQFIGRWRDAP